MSFSFSLLFINNYVKRDFPVIYSLSELMNELIAAEGILGTSSIDANMAEASTSQPKSKGKCDTPI